MELAGSKTETNLMAAFAGESQARNKYTYYADTAKNDGYEQIAAIFEKTADNERAHAQMWGEELGLNAEEASEGKMVAALKRIGFDYVFDTNFAADLTIMEEGNELLERLGNSRKYAWPMFTSCCPGWVSFVSKKYPEYLRKLSTAKSPQQMFGAMAKT